MSTPAWSIRPPRHSRMSTMPYNIPRPALSTGAHDMTRHGRHADAERRDERAYSCVRRPATGMNPAAAPMHMAMTQHGDWMLMLHGLAFVNQVIQSGPRGG